MTYQRKEVIGNCTLYLGDCREVMPTLDRVDAVVTDPPYGVSGGSGTMGRASLKTKYSACWEDSRQYIQEHVVPSTKEALAISKRGVITPGTPCMWLYPEPNDVGCIYQPATSGMNKWGRETSQPVLFYGKDPRAGLTIQNKHVINTAKASDNRHPCAKPIHVTEWMVDRGSVDGETILDPFMGSGTTGVACAKMGRHFIGIEIDPNYFDIACERIRAAYAQPDMFVEAP